MKPVSIDVLNGMREQTIMDVLGIEFTRIGDDFLEAKMPVDRRTHQVHGILHGGASVVLAETIGSVGASLSVDNTQFRCVGVEVNCNHIRSVKTGFVTGVGKALHLGKSTQVWEIKIYADDNKLVSASRLTVAVVAIKANE